TTRYAAASTSATGQPGSRSVRPGRVTSGKAVGTTTRAAYAGAGSRRVESYQAITVPAAAKASAATTRAMTSPRPRLSDCERYPMSIGAGSTDQITRTVCPRSAARTAVATATITRKTGHSTPVEISGDSSIVPAAMRQASRPDDQRWARIIPARARPPTSAYAAGTGTHW